jgi:hypothetical protein
MTAEQRKRILKIFEPKSLERYLKIDSGCAASQSVQHSLYQRRSLAQNLFTLNCQWRAITNYAMILMVPGAPEWINETGALNLQRSLQYSSSFCVPSQPVSPRIFRVHRKQ